MLKPGSPKTWIVLIPSALEGQINADTVQTMSSRVKIIAEGRQWPHHPRS